MIEHNGLMVNKTKIDWYRWYTSPFTVCGKTCPGSITEDLDEPYLMSDRKQIGRCFEGFPAREALVKIVDDSEHLDKAAKLEKLADLMLVSRKVKKTNTYLAALKGVYATPFAAISAYIPYSGASFSFSCPISSLLLCLAGASSLTPLEGVVAAFNAYGQANKILLDNGVEEQALKELLEIDFSEIDTYIPSNNAPNRAFISPYLNSIPRLTQKTKDYLLAMPALQSHTNKLLFNKISKDGNNFDGDTDCLTERGWQKIIGLMIDSRRISITEELGTSGDIVTTKQPTAFAVVSR